MALQHRREAPIRPRFLLALTLSTVTACTIAAPLAIRALRADPTSFAAGTPNSAPVTDRQTHDLSSAEMSELTLDTSSGGLSRGGIGTQSRAKGQDTTTKSDGGAGQGVTTETSVLSNETTAPPDTATATTPTTVEPTPTETTAPTTTDTTAPTSAPTSATTGTTAPATASTTATTRAATTATTAASSTPSTTGTGSVVTGG